MAAAGDAPSVMAPGPTVPAQLPTAPPPRTAAVAPALDPSDPVRIELPTLGVTSAVMALGLNPDGSLQVPPGAYPAGWYAGGPTPGALGPAVVAAHVNWDGQDGVFARISQLATGDPVRITRADSSVVTFSVDRVDQYPKDRFPTDAVYGNIDHAGLRLITCGGVLDTTAHSYLDNIVVYASLTVAS
ncbi:class F sortase [Rhodococcus aerolatus]